MSSGGANYFRNRHLAIPTDAGANAGGLNPDLSKKVDRIIELSEERLLCSKESLRCSEESLRCSKESLRCSEERLRCSEESLRCSKESLRCSEERLRCSEKRLFWKRVFRVGECAAFVVIGYGLYLLNQNIGEEAVKSGREIADKAIDSGKDIADKAVESGKEIADKAVNAGKESMEKAMDAGKEALGNVVHTAGKVAATGIAAAFVLGTFALLTRFISRFKH